MMTEDPCLNRWMKLKLEANRAFEFHPTIRRQTHWRWITSALCAASLAMVLVFRAFIDEPSGKGDDGISMVIGFLSEVDGFDDAALTTGSTADRLLAWQEAPLAESLQVAIPSESDSFDEW